MAALRRASRFMCVALCLVATAVGAAVAGSSGLSATGASSIAAPANRPLHTAFLDPMAFGGTEGSAALDRARLAGARYVRVLVSWGRVSPAGATPPANFNPRDPGDPRYTWTQVDNDIRAVVAKGFVPFVYMQGAPMWAQSGMKQRPHDGPVRPSPAALGDFATALATRYSGSYQGLPRVRYWQTWNEPNLDIFLAPQVEDGKATSPAHYRAMVNAMANAVHAVRPDNVLIAGGLAPFGGNRNDVSADTHDQVRIRPLEFMREFLCMSDGAVPRPTCNDSVTFDVWAHHPYTYGGPTHSAVHKDDVSLGDLDEMRTLLDAASRAGHIKSRGAPDFWITEFSYDSEPGDPKGLPPALHARWTSEALYRMWNDGVSLVTWFLLRDEPFPQQFFQSGLYTSDNKAKPALRAFRFPFVAFRQKNKAVTYWGRTPAGVRAKVVVEQKAGARWKRLLTLTTNRHGIFLGKLPKVTGAGPLRAKLASGKDFSQPFSLKVVKDFRFCPWGSFC